MRAIRLTMTVEVADIGERWVLERIPKLVDEDAGHFTAGVGGLRELGNELDHAFHLAGC